MKSLKEIKQELLKDGAVVRLQDLNKERELLLKIIGNGHNKAEKVLKAASSVRKLKKAANKGFSYKGKHWTQTPEGRERLSKAMKKQWQEKH